MPMDPETRWNWTFGLLAIAAVITGAVITFFIATASLNVQVANLTSKVENMEKYQSLLTERNAIMRADLAIVSTKMTEIETQFCASDIVRNLMHATDLRVQSMMWHHTFPDMIYPTDNAFYPEICNRSIVNSGTSPK